MKTVAFLILAHKSPKQIVRLLKALTKDNYAKYVDIPKQLVKKTETGKMMYAHLADLLRLKLLAKHGGLWIDSTLF